MTLVQTDKKLLALPIILLPILCMVFFAMGGGKNKIGENQKIGGTSTVNSSFPEGKSKEIPVSMEEVYKNAEQDRLGLVENLYPDNLKVKDSLMQDIANKQMEWQRQDELNNLKDSLRRVPQANILQELPLTDKIEKPTITTPVIVDKESLFNTVKFEQEEKKMDRVDTKKISVLAATMADVHVQDRGSVALRLLESIQVGEVTIKKNTVVTGFCTLTTDRLLITVSSLPMGRNNNIKINLVVYDTDGQEGIFAAANTNAEILREAKTEAEILAKEMDSRVGVISRISRIFRKRNKSTGSQEITILEGLKVTLKEKENE